MIEILMNNLGKKEIICPKCASRLKYEKSDIKTHFEEYYNRKDEINYIICPICKGEIKVNKYMMTQ